MFEEAREGNTDHRKHISWLVIPTRDRVRELRSAVLTCTQNAATYGHKVKVFVSDDSLGDESRLMLTHLVGKVTTPIYYAGREEKRVFAERLTAHGQVPREISEFSLFGHTEMSVSVGANRNATILQTLGCLALSIDDDVICRTGRALGTNPNSQTIYSTWQNASDISFFPDRKSALKSVSFSCIDMVGEHNALLGQTTEDILSANSPRLAGTLGEMLGYCLRGFRRQKSRVRVTFNGIVGDSGLNSSVSFLAWNSVNTRKHMLMSEESFKSSTESREVIRQPRDRIISRNGECIGTIMGFDNREVLPPFFPVSRSEDCVFGETLRLCDPVCHFGYLPFVVIHAPCGLPRVYDAEGFARARLCDIVVGFLAKWEKQIDTASRTDRCRSFGRYLADLASFRQEEFDEMIAEIVVDRAISLLGMMGRILHTASCTSESRNAFIQRQISLLEKSQAKPLDLIDLDSTRSGRDVILRRIRELVLLYGRLLVWWPNLIESAKHLADSGTQIGRKLTC